MSKVTLIGRAALDNSDLPVDFICETLIAKAMDKSMAEPFIPEWGDEMKPNVRKNRTLESRSGKATAF
jgi:hypothetical protein